MNLPIEFQNKMKKLLKEDYDLFLSSFDAQSARGIHLNTYALDGDTLISDFNGAFESIPQVKNGFYCLKDKIGSTPLHHAGIIYSQDPGAQRTIGTLPDIFDDNSIILDLCAAPGGKSSQLLSLLKDKNSFVVSNEVSRERNKILQSNMERMGYQNNLILSLYPEKIASLLPGQFTHIVIDAPCSGEGMFRKYPESINEWSPENVNMCSLRQKEIISSIYPALRPGGYIIYSTCTYSPEENEEIVKYMTETFPLCVINPGIHVYPHETRGEGQFYCLLKDKREGLPSYSLLYKPDYKAVSSNDLKIIKESFRDAVFDRELGFYYCNSAIICSKNLPLNISSKYIEKCGALVGSIQKNRLIPHHNFFKIHGKELNNSVELKDYPGLLNDYLMGLEITCPSAKNGFGVITYYGAVVGGFKASNSRLKNYYPKGLRNLTSYL